MNYDDNIETIDKLFYAINEEMQEKMERGITVTSDPYHHYIFDQSDGMCANITEIVNKLDEKLEELESRHLEKLQF